MSACAVESMSEVDQVEQAVVGECTTTNQCKNLYAGATDCRNGEGGICYCGSNMCGGTVGAGVSLPAIIEAEDFVAAYDTTSGNTGGACTNSINSNTDMQSTSDNGGGCNVGWTAAGEWLEYDVQLPTARSLQVILRLAAQNSGKRVRVDVDGVSVGSVTSMANGWQSFHDHVVGAPVLNAGSHTVRVTFLDGNTNLNWISFVPPNESPSCSDGIQNQGESGIDCGGPCATSCNPNPTNTWRVGYSADGNQHDWDDLHATPMSLTLLHRAGLKSRLVHFDYNNHLGNNNAAMSSGQSSNVSWAINQLGYNSSIFFDDQNNLSGAVNSIKNAINASSTNDRFILICAGPMEVCWRGIDAAQASKEQFVTVISHSSWNDNHQDTSQMNHTWTSIQNDFDVLAHHINDQNPPAFKSTCSTWNWIKNVPSYGNGIYERLCTNPTQAAGDASDAGMMYYVIQKNGNISGTSGSLSPTMAQVQSFFGQ